MKEFFYLYSEAPLHNMIKEIFTDFEIHHTPIDSFKKSNFKNKNILLIINESLFEELGESLLEHNNVVIFFLKKSGQKKNNYSNVKFFYGCTNINKFIDEVRTCFASRPLMFKDTKILGTF